jgi:DnaJ-class molecular chaperone
MKSYSELTDTNQSASATGKFQAVNQAYEFLGDVELKNQYDGFGEHGVGKSAARSSTMSTPDQNPQRGGSSEYIQAETASGAKQVIDFSSANEKTVGSGPSPPSFYEVLGVSRDANSDAIKQAYNMLVRLYHPGKSIPCNRVQYDD